MNQITSYNYRSDFLNYKNEKTLNNFNDSITMKRAGATSLKIEIESLQDLKSEKTYYGPITAKQKNIFGRNFMKNYKIGLIKQSVNNPLSSFNKVTTLNDSTEFGLISFSSSHCFISSSTNN